ncbi:MAG: hypothetical protein FRX48_08038 [Lasallia pustulata]|uniref:RRM domain-containing protein n=1 Tax=Lasallia pustulata TaxID=136370 RepID=A0A5M8PHG7_9LECA|nr:MAG: hypothetical protein FRX48_08038 [Lasallia pustulata]
MAAEEDNFDIDIYGDGREDYQQEEPADAEVKAQESSDLAAPSAEDRIAKTTESPDTLTQAPTNGDESHLDMKQEEGLEHTSDVAQKIASTDESTQDPLLLPKQAPQTQGLKRKDGSDDRPVDPGATNALFISDLQWWITDDDIRGWANQSQCEDELEDITFSEHKVNGKSKGQAYVVFKSPQAATAAKHKIQSFGEGQQYKKLTVSFTNPFTNPFRILPKDGPTRNNNQNNNRSTSGGYGASAGMTAPPPQQMNYNMTNSNGGFRGGRGGFNNRGAMNNMPGYNRGGFQGAMTTGFQGAPMGGFQGAPMGGMQQYGGFQPNRGGMMGGMRGGGPMGMHGGRGGMNPNGMMGMPMGGMGMVGMGGMAGPMGGMGGMGMGMPQMGGAMGMQGQGGFQGGPQAHYNPAFFPQQQNQQVVGGVAGDSAWNPHGAKRPRPE